MLLFRPHAAEQASEIHTATDGGVEEVPSSLNAQSEPSGSGAEKPTFPWKRFSGVREIPSDPYPWQKRPPCGPSVLERLLNRGCWTILGAKPTPSCPDGTWQDPRGCYWPAVAETRPPTSIDGGTHE